MPDPLTKDELVAQAAGPAFRAGLERAVLRGLGFAQGLGPGGPDAARMWGDLLGVDLAGVQAGGAARAAGQGLARAPVQPSAEELAAIEQSMPQMPPAPAGAGFNLGIGMIPSVSTKRLEALAQKPGQIMAAGREKLGESEKTARAGLAKQRAALQSEANIGAEQARFEAAQMAGAQAEWARQAGDWQAREDAARVRADAAMTSYRQALDEFKSSKVDPSRWYGEGLGKRVGSAIAVALGSMGQAFLGGPNNALDIINAAIERDIQGQQSEVARKQANVGESANALQIAQRTLGDIPLARDAARLALLNDAKERVATFGLQTKDRLIQAKTQALHGQLDQQTAELEAKLSQGLMDNEMRAAQMELGAEQAVIGAKRSNLQATMAARAAAAQAQGPQMPPGLRLADQARPPPSKEQLAKFQDKFSGFKRLAGSIQEMKREREASGIAGKLTPKGEVLVKQAIGAWADANGYTSEAKQRLLNDPKLAGFPEDVADIGFVMERLDTLLDGATRAITTDAETYNLALDIGTGSRRRVR